MKHVAAAHCWTKASWHGAIRGHSVHASVVSRLVLQGAGPVSLSDHIVKQNPRMPRDRQYRFVSVNAITTIVTTSDGRELCVESGGDPSGRPVLGLLGSPAGRMMMDGWLDNAERDGVHLISYDRPGYGGSTVRSGRSVADCAGDVRAIANTLGIDRLAVWGFSGGGPHALACAALLDDLVCAVATFSSLAPYGEPGLDWFDKMGTENADDARLALDSPNSARQGLVNLRAQLLALTSEQVDVRARRLPSAEASALHYYRWWLLTNLKEAFAPGPDGKWDDGRAFLSPWGFALESVSVPVQLWHGKVDETIPFSHSQWLADHIPAAELLLTDAEGHLSVFVNHLNQAQEWLLQHF